MPGFLKSLTFGFFFAIAAIYLRAAHAGPQEDLADFLKTYPLIRVVINSDGDPNDLGAVGAALKIIERLRLQKRFQGQIEVIYELSDIQKLKDLVPGFDRIDRTDAVLSTYEHGPVRFIERNTFRANFLRMGVAGLALSPREMGSSPMKWGDVKAQAMLQLQSAHSDRECFIETFDGSKEVIKNAAEMETVDQLIFGKDAASVQARATRVRALLSLESHPQKATNLYGLWDRLMRRGLPGATPIESLPVFGLAKIDELMTYKERSVDKSILIFQTLVQALVDGTVMNQENPLTRATGPILVPVFDQFLDELPASENIPTEVKLTQVRRAMNVVLHWLRILFRVKPPESAPVAPFSDPAEEIRLQRFLSELPQFKMNTSDGREGRAVSVTDIRSPDLFEQIQNAAPGEIKIIVMGRVKQSLFTEFLTTATFPPAIDGKEVSRELLQRGIPHLNLRGDVDSLLVQDLKSKGFVADSAKARAAIDPGLQLMARASRFLGQIEGEDPKALMSFLFSSRDQASPQYQYFARRGFELRSALLDSLDASLLKVRSLFRKSQPFVAPLDLVLPVKDCRSLFVTP